MKTKKHTSQHPGDLSSARNAGKKPARQRLDQLLVERGLAASTDEALRMVLAHEVRVDDVYATSAAIQVPKDAELLVKGRKSFVSRGGYKLQGALDYFQQSVSGLHCLDIGASTGGFTDCLLQNGAASVVAIDVAYGQLAWSLRQDPRVQVIERTNIREIAPEDLGAPFEFIVIDVSFIGLASLAPTIAALSAPGTVFVGLIKPQFESHHDETEGGIVRDPAVRERTVTEVCEALTAVGFAVDGVVESSITGAQGNIEFLVRAVYGEDGGSGRNADVTP